jgi:DNA-directed RNA polymerase specialized sigma24 family protein
VGRSWVPLDEVGGLLHAAGRGDLDSFAAFYDRTAPVVFNLLQHVLGDSTAAERATVRVYVRVWRTASAFDPAVTSGGTYLMQTLQWEFDGRERRLSPQVTHSAGFWNPTGAQAFCF